MGTSHTLGDIRLFNNLSREQLEKIEKIGEYREYNVGETIFSKGNNKTHIYCIIDGRAEITLKLGDTSDEAPVHTGVPGSVFGEFILFEKSKRSASARASKPVKIFAATDEKLRALFVSDPATGYIVMDNLCRILVGRVSKTTKELRSSLMW